MSEAPQRNRQDSSDDSLLLLPMPPAITFIQIKESLEEIEESSADVALFWWILALLFFGLGDTISSFLVFAQGGAELNPVMKWALALPGELMGFVFVKTLALSVLYAIAYFWDGPHRWVIPVMMTIAGVYLTTSNTLAYLQISGITIPFFS